ncbi:MAG: polysaccharide lyase 11, partial [Candidatus Brocadiia bacterium]
VDLQCVLEVSVGQELGQMRAVPVWLDREGPPALLLVYGADAEDDPYHEMFFFPRDTLKLMLISADGHRLWHRDLGPGVVPGVWFCPVFPFDLNGDGVEEVWLVANTDADHPLGLSNYRLERTDSRTGQVTGQWQWPRFNTDETMSHMFRNFILGGTCDGEAVLVTAQGTYEAMHLMGWSRGLEPRWQLNVAADEPGARGSHMCPLVDLDSDGDQEVMWGERCIALDDGHERFCADRRHYRGHSDVVQPVWDHEGGRWVVYTCRESDPEASPRVALYDNRGRRIWGAVEEGHMDMGWVARLGEGGRPVAMAIRIGHKTAGPAGFTREGVEEFVFDALTGEPLELGFSVYRTVPVDLDGDGRHELVRGLHGANGEVLDADGDQVGSIEGQVAMVGRFLDRPGEQILAYSPDGTVRVYADASARDSDAAMRRYEHPLYRANQRLSATGYNISVLGGL